MGMVLFAIAVEPHLGLAGLLNCSIGPSFELLSRGVVQRVVRTNGRYIFRHGGSLQALRIRFRNLHAGAV